MLELGVHGAERALASGRIHGGERTGHILTIVATCIAHEVNPRLYLHLVTRLIVHGWPQAKLRDLLPDRLAAQFPELLTRQAEVADIPPIPLLPQSV